MGLVAIHQLRIRFKVKSVVSALNVTVSFESNILELKTKVSLLHCSSYVNRVIFM